MIQRHRLTKAASRPDGYALIAALLILLLMTAFGIWAMLTSSSESVLSGNINEEQLMFFFAEQGIDRILSHLHYMDQGLYGQVLGMGYPYEDAGNTLDPINVLSTRRVLQASGSSLATSPLFDMTAYIDPKNFDHGLQRPLTRPLAINVKVDNKITDYTKAFRVFVQPRSIWDFAYFSNNHNPAYRSNYSPCNGASNSWYDCQTTFHGPRTLSGEDGTSYQPGEKVQGDMYIRNASTNPDTGKLFARGWPDFSGQVLFRSVTPFDMGSLSGGTYTNSANQTRGGSSIVKQPAAREGMIYNARDIEMFSMDYLTAPESDARYFRGNSDITLKYPGDNYIWKIMFRNDLATGEPSAEDPCQEEYRVGSAITKKTNDGNINCEDNEGVFLLYRLPWHDDPTNRVYWGNKPERVAAYYGDIMSERDRAMQDVGGERWAPGVTWSDRVDPVAPRYAERINFSADSGEHTFGAYDPTDIQTPPTSGFGYKFLYVPSQGSSCGTGDCNGIIVVEGSVMVSGVLDGKVTIVALGDIILDHEIEYEDYNQKVCEDNGGADCNFASTADVDMLGLFATGNIIIPNSLPDDPLHSPTTYEDDWSDSEYSSKLFAPTGIFDQHPYEQREDDGTEDIHAVMVSFGQGPCTGFDGSASCESPEDLDIRQFQVGLYAVARTSNRRPDGIPFDQTTLSWDDAGNDSGTLRIKGALIQNIPGRVGYDYYGSANWARSSCQDGGGGGACNYIGHRMELFYDDRLHYTAPVTPRTSGGSHYLPYGRAAYEIISWEEMRNPNEMAMDLW